MAASSATVRRLAGVLVGLGLVGLLAAGALLWFGATGGSRAPASAAADGFATGPASVRLAWDPSPSDRVAGYRILSGTEPGRYLRSTEVGIGTSATLSGLVAGTRYYIVVVAVDAHGAQSPPSNEIEAVARE